MPVFSIFYDNNITMNAHGMMEYQISLEDAVLKGSKENILEVNLFDQVLSTFQIRFNNTNYQADAYNTCLNNTFFKCYEKVIIIFSPTESFE